MGVEGGRVEGVGGGDLYTCHRGRTRMLQQVKEAKEEPKEREVRGGGKGDIGMRRRKRRR